MNKKKLIEKLHSMNFNVIPLRPLSKEPMGEKWKRFQSEKYTGEFPNDCNLGIICGTISNNLFVLDLDDDSLYSEFKNYKTFTVKSARGYHLYFRSNGFLPANKKHDDKRGRHIDIKSEGGYVLTTGSIHPDTKREYEIILDEPVMVINPAEIKEKLIKLEFNVEKQPVKDIENGVAEGSRNDAMFKYACYLMREEHLYGVPLEQKVKEVNAKNKPPLSDSEIMMILSQIPKYEGKNIKPVKSLQDIKEEPIQKIPIQKITPEHEGISVEFDALIAAVDKRRTFTKWAEFTCDACGNSKELECDDYHVMGIPFCSKCKRNYSMNHSIKKTEYIQVILIQEFLEDSINNTPVEFDAEIIGTSVGEAFTGDRMTFVAKFRSLPQKDGYNNIMLEVLSMKPLTQKYGCMPDREEIEKWRNINIYEKVRDSISPELKISPVIKESCMLALAGGQSLNDKRDKSHIIIIGDAQTAKSELLKFLHKMTPGSGFGMGGKSSGAGLTIGMVKLHNGVMVPRAGLAPSHTGHPIYYDEVDKSKDEDRDSILECMEQQMCSLAKAGHPNVRLPSVNTWICAGNPKHGKYNSKYPSVMDNFNLSVPFVSRFDIVWLLLDQNDPAVDDIIIRHIQDYKNHKECYLSMEELQRFFVYVNTLSPVVPEALGERINDIYRKIRPLNKLDGLPIGLRQYYGLYRLVTSSASCHLRETVTEEDIAIVENIVRESLKSLKMDMEKGEQIVPMEPQRNTKEKVFLETWSECMDEYNSVDREEFLEKLSIKSPFNQLNSAVQFEKYKNAGRVEIDNQTGRCKLVTK